MNKLQKNLYSMLGRVRALILDNAAKFGAMPALEMLKNMFLALYDEIGETDIAYLSAKAGKTDAKHNCEDAMIDAVIPLASIIGSYAVMHGNMELAARVRTTPSELDKMRERDTLNKCKEITNEADQLSEALNTEYLWTVEKTQAVKDTITACENSLNVQETGGVEKSALRLKLIESFSEAMDLLNEKMDKVMEIFLSTDPEFYNEYQSARVIKDLGIRHETTEPEVNP